MNPQWRIPYRAHARTPRCILRNCQRCGTAISLGNTCDREKGRDALHCARLVISERVKLFHVTRDRHETRDCWCACFFFLASQIPVDPPVNIEFMTLTKNVIYLAMGVLVNQSTIRFINSSRRFISAREETNNIRICELLRARELQLVVSIWEMITFRSEKKKQKTDCNSMVVIFRSKNIIRANRWIFDRAEKKLFSFI